MQSKSRTDPSGEFLELLEKGKIVFFVGSGISMVYPACLPSAARLLSVSASLNLPCDCPKEVEKVTDSIQPEVFYQELMAFIGEDALLPFKSLSHSASRPSLAHYIIVKTAAMNSVTVITTNFDCLLESAARDLGINVEAIGATGPYTDSHDKLYIWKVHGSVEHRHTHLPPSNILATMARITQPNRPLLQSLHALFTDRHVCFIGYSGRDIDLFPLIRKFPGIRPPIWIDPKPSPQVVERATSIGARLILSTLDRIIIGKRSKLLDILQASGVVLSDFKPTKAQEQRTRSAIEQELSQIRGEIAGRQPLSFDQKRLFLALCLNRIGDHVSAYVYLGRHYQEIQSGIKGGDKVLTLLTMARLADCVSDYRASENYARTALAESKRLLRNHWTIKSVSLRIQALHAVAMAKKMQVGPGFSYGVNNVDFSPSPRATMGVLSRYFWYAIQMRILLAMFQFVQPRTTQSLFQPESTADVWVLWGWNWYLDHKLILLSMLSALSNKIPGIQRFGEKWLTGALATLADQARRIGDARSLAHVQKELQRHGVPLQADLTLAFSAYELTTDPLNRALVHRNAGDDMLKQGRIDDAIKEFSTSLRLALQCGNKATVLKALVGLYVCGQPIRQKDLLEHVRGLTGVGYERFIEQFRQALS